MDRYRIMKNKYSYYKVQVRRFMPPEVFAGSGKYKWMDLEDHEIYHDFCYAKSRKRQEEAEEDLLMKRSNNDWEVIDE